MRRSELRTSNFKLRTLLALSSPLWLLELRRALPAWPWLEVSTDPLLLAAAFLALRASPLSASLAGGVTGLLLDLHGDVRLGLGAALLSATAWVFACAKGTFLLDRPFTRPLFVLLFALAFELPRALLVHVAHDASLLALAERGARIALATAIATPVGLPVARLLEPPGRAP
jgi:hypothetical protein